MFFLLKLSIKSIPCTLELQTGRAWYYILIFHWMITILAGGFSLEMFERTYDVILSDIERYIPYIFLLVSIINLCLTQILKHYSPKRFFFQEIRSSLNYKLMLFIFHSNNHAKSMTPESFFFPWKYTYLSGSFSSVSFWYCLKTKVNFSNASSYFPPLDSSNGLTTVLPFVLWSLRLKFCF